ncbi:Methionine import ATP-binding protein MetN [bioreactor metagenome]|uniref:Methionine import ATP-binding protein MetN n=1 Tax=bioreactor metagenome TaxID=1076179 RepID=A0A644Y7H7_9ZZZZ|nr:ATP-binding cassette domain-containing protein [Erysipelotrichaceae bacterium]
MIELRNVGKTFENQVEAVKDVSIKIKAEQIFGIIGYSGAGKSTLIRLINLLEKPDQGEVIVDGVNLCRLTPKELRASRKKIGMIFQRFNLFNSRTVYENVRYPLEGSGLPQTEIRKRVLELLDLVGLSDKTDSYPSQLSGGQMQRVGIARALADNPKVLLCDEATSALDPQTTQSILRLLKELNKKLKLTLVIITHQMSVIKDICDEVAIMDNGRIIEQGSVLSIFSNPQHDVTKQFIHSADGIDKLEEFISSHQITLKDDEQMVQLSYGSVNTSEALISYIISVYQVTVNILFANIELIDDQPIGWLVVVLGGENTAAALRYLQENGVRVEVKQHV